MATNPAPACECDTMTSVAASRDAVRREPLYPTELGRLRHTQEPALSANAQANLPEPLDRRHEMVGEDHEGATAAPDRPTDSCSRRSRVGAIADDVVAAIAASHRAVDRARILDSDSSWHGFNRYITTFTTPGKKPETEPAHADGRDRHFSRWLEHLHQLIGVGSLADDLAFGIDQPVGRNARHAGLGRVGQPALIPGKLKPFDCFAPGVEVFVDAKGRARSARAREPLAQLGEDAGICCLHGPHQLAQKCTNV